MAEVNVYYDRKLQMEQFEPITCGGSVTVSVGDDEDPSAVYAATMADLQEAVERELVERIARAKMAETGPSVPAVKAVIEDHTDVLDSDTATEVAEALVAEFSGGE